MVASDVVYVFASTGRFRSDEELEAFVVPTYDADGDEVPSPFMTEVGLTGCEPMAVERVHAATPTSLPRLLEGASYGDEWLPLLDAGIEADAAICLFPPNRPSRPERSSLRYCGVYPLAPGRR